jgi:hypothetical protein
MGKVTLYVRHDEWVKGESYPYPVVLFTCRPSGNDHFNLVAVESDQLYRHGNPGSNCYISWWDIPAGTTLAQLQEPTGWQRTNTDRRPLKMDLYSTVEGHPERTRIKESGSDEWRPLKRFTSDDLIEACKRMQGTGEFNPYPDMFDDDDDDDEDEDEDDYPSGYRDPNPHYERLQQRLEPQVYIEDSAGTWSMDRNDPKWGIVIPTSIADQLTPDTAPELERRLTLALRILKEGK